MSFGTPPPLIATDQILYSVATESQGYRLDGRQAGWEARGEQRPTRHGTGVWRGWAAECWKTRLAQARVVWGMATTEPLGHPNAAWMSR